MCTCHCGCATGWRWKTKALNTSLSKQLTRRNKIIKNSVCKNIELYRNWWMFLTNTCNYSWFGTPKSPSRDFRTLLNPYKSSRTGQYHIKSFALLINPWTAKYHRKQLQIPRPANTEVTETNFLIVFSWHQKHKLWTADTMIHMASKLRMQHSALVLKHGKRLLAMLAMWGACSFWHNNWENKPPCM